MKFDKNIPVPNRDVNNHGALQEDIKTEMEVGDSIVIQTTNFNAFRAGLAKKTPGMKFTYKTISEISYRLWRIK